MQQSPKQIMIWAPRALGILFTLFVSLFALDVFDAGYSFGETVIALFMHLIPSFLLLFGLVMSWRWQWVGAVVFLSFGVWYLVIFGGQSPPSILLLLAGVPFLIGGLFLVNWLYQPKLQTRI